jgi:hypothetical protein
MLTFDKVIPEHGAPSAQMSAMGGRVTPLTTSPFQFYIVTWISGQEKPFEWLSYLKLDIGKLNTITSECVHRSPVLVDVEAICSASRDEVLKEDIGNATTATVTLEHHSLVASVGIDITGGNGSLLCVLLTRNSNLLTYTRYWKCRYRYQDCRMPILQIGYTRLWIEVRGKSAI